MTHPHIEADNAAHRLLIWSATRRALRVERVCPHSLVIYDDGHTTTTSICFHCRMEWQNYHGSSPRTAETIDRRYAAPHVVGVDNIYKLRTIDRRPIIKVNYWDMTPPIRKRKRDR